MIYKICVRFDKVGTYYLVTRDGVKGTVRRTMSGARKLLKKRND
jgi:hypothetical protein